MRMIKSNSQLFLVASKDLEFHTMTDPERRFQIKLYKNTDPSNGLAVTIQFFSNHTWRVVHCTEEGNCKRVTASPMQVPDSLPNSSNEAVFFLQAVRGQNNKYRFESSVWRQWYLSVSLEGDVYKLVLRKVADEVDEAAQFFMTKPEG
ncbi:interleukin-18 [Amia ocellicauda]|uniref:interleukin-18 n=1 Tax=Amia ocellicauda TaxID=2972642 RepID=UPI003464D8E0